MFKGRFFYSATKESTKWHNMHISVGIQIVIEWERNCETSQASKMSSGGLQSD